MLGVPVLVTESSLSDFRASQPGPRTLCEGAESSFPSLRVGLTLNLRVGCVRPAAKTDLQVEASALVRARLQAGKVQGSGRWSPWHPSPASPSPALLTSFAERGGTPCSQAVSLAATRLCYTSRLSCCLTMGLR